MKKILILLCLLLMIMPTIACAQGTYSISELHDMYDGQRWQGEYHTARNETVVIDAPFLIPDVDAAPVIVVSAYPQLDQSFHDTYTSPDKKLRWQTYADSEPGFFRFGQYQEFTIAPEDMTRIDFNEAWYTPEEMSADIVAENSTINMMDAYEEALSIYDNVLNTYGIGAVELVPRMAATLGLYREKDQKPLVDHRGYEFEFLQAIRGIPMLCNTGEYWPSSYQTNYRWESTYSPKATITISSPGRFDLYGIFRQEEEVLYTDIPLTDFSKCQEKLVSMIEAGLVRQVRKIHLAYSLYTESSHNAHKTNRWVAVPTWIVDCEYYSSKDKEQKKGYTEENYYHNQWNGFNYLMFNAQTGEFLDLKNTSKNRNDMPKIITWDKAK